MTLSLLNELCVERTEGEWMDLVRDLSSGLEGIVRRPVTLGALFMDEERDFNCNCRIKFESEDGAAKTQWEGMLYAGRAKESDAPSLVIAFPFVQGVRVEPPGRWDQYIEVHFPVSILPAPS